MTLQQRIAAEIRDVPDFPKPGILFKDITTLFQNPKLCSDIIDEAVNIIRPLNIDAIACVESRGFFFGPQICKELAIPFVPIRKAGKLPYTTVSYEYDLEYGSATIEMHEDAIKPGSRVLIHDDLLATGGTAAAAAELVGQFGDVCGFLFLVNLSFLNGKEKLEKYSTTIHELVSY